MVAGEAEAEAKDKDTISSVGGISNCIVHTSSEQNTIQYPHLSNPCRTVSELCLTPR